MVRQGGVALKIVVCAAEIRAPLPEPEWRRALDLLPGVHREKVGRFHRWQDRHNSLAGKLLLRRCMADRYRIGDVLERIRWDELGRPHLEENIDFSISHTNGLVVCAIAEQGKVGIDVEEVREIEFSDFSTAFSQEEWTDIRNSPAPLTAFYKLWTRKEAVLKADGRGLGLEGVAIQWRSEKVLLEGTEYQIREIALPTMWLGHVACSEPFDELEILWDENWYHP